MVSGISGGRWLGSEEDSRWNRGDSGLDLKAEWAECVAGCSVRLGEEFWEVSEGLVLWFAVGSRGGNAGFFLVEEGGEFDSLRLGGCTPGRRSGFWQ